MSGDFEIAETFDYGDRIPVGTDITGSGKPEAVVSEWSGGAHCCYTYHVFQLADHFREIARLDLGDAEAEFIDLDHGGSYEVETVDYDFGYWRTGFTESPAPRIVLRFTRGRYRLAPDLMKTPAPEPSEFEKLVDLVSSDNDWSSVVPKDCEQDCGIPVALWKNMLDLMYEGHTDLAWRLFDESWPDDRNDKKDFASQFCRRLRDSYYWPSLEKSIGPCPRK